MSNVEGSDPLGDGDTVYVTDKEGGKESTSPTEVDTKEPHKDAGWLKYQYHTLGKSTIQIAEECDMSDGAISYWMNKHDISARRAGQPAAHNVLEDESWLRQEYIEKERSSTDIAKQLSVNEQTVLDWLNRHDIETRDKAKTLSIKINRELEDEKYRDESWLRHKYVKQGLSITEIAKMCGCSRPTIRNWLENYDIETRTVREQNLINSKKEKEKPKNENRKLVTSEGIDASWKSIDKKEKKTLNYRDKDWLEKQLRKNKTYQEIAESCEVDCSTTTIGRWIKRFGLREYV